MQKFSQFYVTYRNIVQFESKLWKLDYFEKSVLELMADPVRGRELQNGFTYRGLSEYFGKITY